ncbi:MAG: hypothetical protein U5R49_21395 [Deltaproteobacteria bacterium]|nr:hypothetical protein [Deltaproteobacteria bacterium]
MKMYGHHAAVAIVLFALIVLATGDKADASEDRANQGVFLDLYQEPYQQAFHILVPRGWKAEGGMIRLSFY